MTNIPAATDKEAEVTVRVTSIHHVAVRFDCPVDKVWNDIALGFGLGRRFEAQGYRVATIPDDPRAYLGGYRMWREGHADRDERLVFLSEHDAVAGRLSLSAHYLGTNARGTLVNATYSAVPDGDGSWYRLDCHATHDLQVNAGASPADVAAIMAASKAEMDAGLNAAFEARRSELERP